MTIGEQIQNLRIAKALTQERLAEMLEVSRQSVSKWELGQAVPDVDKIIRMSELFDVSTDTILLRDMPQEKRNPLHLGTIYLVVKDFDKSVDFYEKFLGITVSDRCRSGNRFVNFYFDNKCLSLMNESNLCGHCTDPDSPYKFVQNYWVENLTAEHKRVKALDIGEVTEIRSANPSYYYFHLFDPDNNVIEVTGGISMEKCQSCGMTLSEGLFGTNADGTANREYCKYCYQKGAFTADKTFEQAVESNIRFLLEDGVCKTEQEAREMLTKEMRELKRWKKA